MDSDDRNWITRAWDSVADLCVRFFAHLAKKCGPDKLWGCVIVFGAFGILIIAIVSCGCFMYGQRITWLMDWILERIFRRRPPPRIDYHHVELDEMPSHDSGTDQAFYDPSNLLQMPVEHRRRPRGVRIRSDESGVDMASPAASEPLPDPEPDCQDRGEV